MTQYDIEIEKRPDGKFDLFTTSPVVFNLVAQAPPGCSLVLRHVEDSDLGQNLCDMSGWDVVLTNVYGTELKKNPVNPALKFPTM